MTQQEEKKKKATAALTTVVVNGLILLIMLFAGAWSSPGSGEGDYPGIEVNLGYDEQGSGDIEPMTPVGTEEAQDVENPPAEEVKEEQVQASEPEPVAQEETPNKVVDDNTLTDPNSDVEIKEEKKAEKPVEKTPEKPVVKTEKPAEKAVVETPKKVEEKPKAVYQGKSTSKTDGDGTGKQGTEGNQGDDVGKEGNKGVPGGTPGAAVYKGRPGGGDGSSLDLYGWDWDNIPEPNTPSNETSGRIVFTIYVNDNGELEKYEKESSTVSAAAERACVESLQKLTFTKKSGAKVPELSKGKITFVIRSK